MFYMGFYAHRDYFLKFLYNNYELLILSFNQNRTNLSE